MKRVFYITRSDLSQAPYPELTLPALARDGWELVVAGPNSSKSSYRKNLPFACQTIDLPANGTFGAELATFRRLQQARLGKFDVIYVNCQSMSARAAIGLCGPVFGKKIVYHNPDYYSPFDHPWYYRAERHFCRNKVHLYINNEFHRGYVTSTAYRSTCPVITCPPNLPRAWPTPRPSAEKRAYISGGNPDAFVLIVHGGFHQLRMTPQLVEALAMLPDKIRLVMTGGKRKRDEVDDLFDRLNVAHRIIRLPFMDFDELLTYTINADAGVLLYQNNDLGNFFTAPGRLTEYLLCGLPLLTSDHTGIENIMLKHRAGQTASAADPRSIAEAIRTLEAGTRAGLYAHSRMRSLFDDRFAFDHWEDRFLEHFNAMVKGTQRSKNQRPPFPW